MATEQQTTAAAAAKSEADATRSKILEGVDFIETEEDAEAVESAVVKIQSTFRGKKIRSRLGQKPQAASNEKEKEKDKTSSSSTSGEQQTSKAVGGGKAPGEKNKKAGEGEAEAEEEKLRKDVATMQVNDDNGRAGGVAQKPATGSKLPEEEAERAATKIQAGFKGYKTRKELEGKLSGQVAAGGHTEPPKD